MARDEQAGIGPEAPHRGAGQLEKAAELAAKRGKAAAVAEAKAGALDGERERLLARIAELEEELAALSGVTQEVEGRLDGAIGEIVPPWRGSRGTRRCRWSM